MSLNLIELKVALPRTQDIQTKECKNSKINEEDKDQHPYKGNFIDFVG